MHLQTGQTESSSRESRRPRIYGLDADGKPFNTIVIVRSPTAVGAVLGDVHVSLNVGDLIGVQCEAHKGKCRVQWIGTTADGTDGDVGVECVDGGNVLSPEDSQSANDTCAISERHVTSAVPPASERRNAKRYTCDIGVEIGIPGSEIKMWSRCTDISQGGCYIETLAPMPVGSLMELKLMLDPESLHVDAVVRTSFPGMGMGVELVFEENEQIQLLRRYLQRKFQAPGPVEIPKKVPDVQKLTECLEKILAWGATAALQESDRRNFEALASLLRQELQSLRSQTKRDGLVRQTLA